MTKAALVIDLGTTAVKALVLTAEGELVARAEVPAVTTEPQAGWYEQDPEMMIEQVRTVVATVRRELPRGITLTACGFATQRETVIAWDRATGQALAPAILWRDERTAPWCVARTGFESLRRKTGLPLEAYFSASKIRWLLDHHEGVRAAAAAGTLAVGTPESWLMYRLLDGQPHQSDWSNACRTLLFNIETAVWDPELLEFFDIPHTLLPETFPSVRDWGWFDGLPCRAVAGDQQGAFAAARARGADAKVTYGTGIFLMIDTGPTPMTVPGWYTTLQATTGERRYALEAKLDWGGAVIGELLGQPERLEPVLDRAARAVAETITSLPLRPEKIILDGGVTRSDYLVRQQTALLEGYAVLKQEPYDGTALGIAKLALESVLG